MQHINHNFSSCMINIFFTFITRFTPDDSIQLHSFFLKSQFCFHTVKYNCKYTVKSIWISLLLLPFQIIEQIHIVCVVCVSYWCHNHIQTTRHKITIWEDFQTPIFIESLLRWYTGPEFLPPFLLLQYHSVTSNRTVYF